MMPVIIGSNSSRPSDVQIHMYAILALIEKKQKHTFTQSILHGLVCVLIMTSFALKASLFISCVLLAIAISMLIYLLHAESSNLRVIQNQLLDLVRNTPQTVIDDIMNESEEQ